MDISVIDIFPKVFKSNSKERVYVSFSESVKKSGTPEIKIQPMEAYSIPHTSRYRIDEEDRYPFFPLECSESGVYFFDFDFTSEQKYSVKIKLNEEVIFSSFLYAVDNDLAELKPYKGDTHLHSCRSDGEGTPFEVACAYRNAGFDFIALTDHHIMEPSIEAKRAVEALTDKFYVFRGEEVHNKGMGYFHIVNFNGESSVNKVIETDDAYVESEIQKILNTRNFDGLFDPRCVAYRIFIANEIRRRGGIAIMAHPYWDAYGEYHMQTEEFVYHWKMGDFDALEVIASCDGNGNGNNLQEMLRNELVREGYKIPIVGSSDAHTENPKYDYDLFNLQFTVAFAKSFEDIPNAILEERVVAVDRKDDVYFRAVGKFRYVKYARFLMDEYFPKYSKLTAEHALALATNDKKEIAESEKKIENYKSKFFAFN